MLKTLWLVANGNALPNSEGLPSGVFTNRQVNAGRGWVNVPVHEQDRTRCLSCNCLETNLGQRSSTQSVGLTLLGAACWDCSREREHDIALLCALIRSHKEHSCGNLVYYKNPEECHVQRCLNCRGRTRRPELARSWKFKAIAMRLHISSER